MIKKSKKLRSVKRLTAFLLAFAALAQMAPKVGADGLQSGGANNEIELTKTFYKWHHFTKSTSKENIIGYYKNSSGEVGYDRVPILVTWSAITFNPITFEIANNWYYASVERDGNSFVGQPLYGGNGYYPDFNVSFPDDFITTELITTWTVQHNGRMSKDHGKTYDYYFHYRSGDGDIRLKDRNGGNFKYTNANDSSRTSWTICTWDDSGGYRKELGNSNHAVIYYQDGGGIDTGFYHKGTELYAHESSTYNYPEFVVYYAEPVNYTAVQNITVEKGSMFNISGESNGGVVLDDGCTITVEPGATLSISGQFFNNGKINNYGTVIVQPNATISSYMPKNEDAGSINNYGGEYNQKTVALERLTDYQKMVTTRKSECEAKLIEIQAVKDQLEYTDPSTGERIGARVDLENYMATQEYKDAVANAEKAESDVAAMYTQLEIPSQKIADYEEAQAALPEEKRDKDEPKEIKAAREEVKKLNEDIENRIAERDEYLATYNELDEAVAKLVGQQETLESEYDALHTNLLWLQEKVAYYQELYDNADQNLLTAEGNLIVCENASVVLSNYTDTANKITSQLTVSGGGSIVCNGTIVSPNSVVVDNSKFQVRSSGAVFTGYRIISNLINTKSIEVKNQKDPTRMTAEGLSCCRDSQFGFTFKGNAMLQNDGSILTVSGLTADSVKTYGDGKTAVFSEWSH